MMLVEVIRYSLLAIIQICVWELMAFPSWLITSSCSIHFRRVSCFLRMQDRPDRRILMRKGCVLLLYKRREADRFRWPCIEQEILAIISEQYTWLMQRLSIEQTQKIKKIEIEKLLLFCVKKRNYLMTKTVLSFKKAAYPQEYAWIFLLSSMLSGEKHAPFG